MRRFTGPGCAGCWGRLEKEFSGAQVNAVDTDETMLAVLREEVFGLAGNPLVHVHEPAAAARPHNFARKTWMRR